MVQVRGVRHPLRKDEIFTVALLVRLEYRRRLVSRTYGCLLRVLAGMCPLPDNQPVQTYRNPRWALVIQGVLSTFMALIGVTIAVHPGNAGHPGTAPGYIAFGSILTTACIFMTVGQLMSRLIVTEHGLTWRNFLRTRSVAWTDVQEVLVVPANALGRYYSPSIKAAGRSIRINCVIGPRRYTEAVVAAIRDAQVRARAAAASVPQP
jgi:Bacterial PH domain